MKSEEFPHQTFDPVPLSRATHLPAGGYPQSPFMNLVGEDKNLEMLRALTSSIMKHPLEFGCFEQPFLLAKRESLHGQQSKQIVCW